MSVENKVRTIFAEILKVPPGNIRPETIIRHGDLKSDTLRRIAWSIAVVFHLIPFDGGWPQDTWTSVADAIEWVEKVLESKKQRAA